jgi:hypothetical protein
MVMATPCLSGWLLGRSMLIGKQTGANGTGKDAAGQHGQSAGLAGIRGPKIEPDEFLKFR